MEQVGYPMKSLLATVASVAVIFSAGSSAALAQNQQLISYPSDIVTNFDPANIGPILTELGIVWQQRDVNGRTIIAASVGGYLSFNIIPTACIGVNKTNCIGMNVIALYGGSNVNTQTVSAYNQSIPFVSAGKLSNNAGAFISRYEIADYGIPRGNVASSLRSFVEAADNFKEEISNGHKTVSAEGFADDLSAPYLNRQSAVEAGVPIAASASQNSPIHQAGFDETSELVRALMASDQAPQNKIKNISR